MSALHRMTAAFWLFLVAIAAAAPLPRFSQQTDLPAYGLTLPVMQSARIDAPMPPEVVRYQWSDGVRSWTEDRSDPFALWRGLQRVALWHDRFGNELLLACATHFPPGGFEHPHVTEAEFEAWCLDGAHQVPEQPSADAMTAWVEAYDPGVIAGAPRRMQNLSTRIRAVEFPTQDGAARAWMFQLNARYPGQSDALRNWFYLRYRAAEAVRDEAGLNRVTRNDLLGGIRTIPMREAGVAAGVDPQQRLWPQGRGARYADDPERRRGRESIANLAGWWYMESDHYILLSNDPSAERRAAQILTALESIRACFAAQVPMFRRAEPMTGIVRLFRTDDEFMRYFQESNLPLPAARTAGLFSGATRELAVRPGTQGNRMRVLQHEAFHQYLFQAWPNCNSSPWINEGSAEFFGSFEYRSNRWTLTEERVVVNGLEALARNRDVDWEELLRTFLLWDYPSFYNPQAHIARGTAFSYAFSYGLMHFLYRGAPALRNRPYRDILPTYLETLEATRDPVEASIRAFKLDGNGDYLKSFARDFREYWTRSSERTRAARQPIPGT